jgi:hypothetical protein
MRDDRTYRMAKRRLLEVTGLLVGARTDERAFADKRGPDPATKCGAGCGTGIEELEDPDASAMGLSAECAEDSSC